MERLNIIVAYRDRKQHKNIFVESLYKYLSEKPFQNFRIYIIEQSVEKEFNKGCLFNIGFLETLNEDGSYYCFHDIDLLPKSPKASYEKPPADSIVHPYGHKHCLGGKILINPETYKKLNGFSTKYWGWGFEDTDFMLRARYNGVKVIRDNFTERFKSKVYFELDAHNKAYFSEKLKMLNTKVNEILLYKTLLDPSVTKDEGLTSTEYVMKGREVHEKYTHLVCEIKNHNDNENYSNSLQKSLGYLQAGT